MATTRVTSSRGSEKSVVSTEENSPLLTSAKSSSAAMGAGAGGAASMSKLNESSGRATGAPGPASSEMARGAATPGEA
ncbi:hypothetical protein COEX109129_36720 [Corallococcus exiguus]